MLSSILLDFVELYKKGRDHLGEIDRIRQLAKSRDITMNSLCRAIGKSSSYFADKRRTGSPIPQDVLDIIAARLGTTISYIIGECEDPSPHSSPSFNPDSEFAKLADIFSGLNSSGRRQLISYGRYLSSQTELQAGRSRLASLRHYLTPAAAGYASPIEGQDYELLSLPGTPSDADFCVTVSGDSMEPVIEDGALAFVSKNTDLRDMDVGLFYLDGDVLIKRYHRESNGDVSLISANPARQDANRHITGDSTSTLVCLGRVLLPR